MDVKKVINNRIFLSSTKNGSFDYSTSISSNIQQFHEKDDECNYLLFEYFIYKILQFKIKNNILINSDIIIISEDFLNNNEKIIKERNDTYAEKIFLIPIYDNANKKWGLIVLSNLFKDENNFEMIAKVIISNKNNKNFENILDNIVRKIKTNLKNEEKIKYKIDILDIGGTANSSKFLLNLINILLEQNRENLEEYINNLFNYKNNREVNSIKNSNNDGKGLIEEINSNNEFFKDLFKNYSIEYNEFIKNKNIDDNSDDNFDIKIEEEDNNEKGNEISFDKSKKKFKENFDKKFNDEINSKINDKKNKKKEKDEIDKLAKNVVNNIMNFPIYMEKESDNSKKEKNLNIPEIKPQNLIVYDILNKKSNKNKNDICDIEFEDIKDDNPNDIANNSADDIFDLNFTCMIDNKCENKKIDEVTKNTIDDILDSVLKDMKINKKKEKKVNKKTCKNIKKFKNFRLRALNIDPKFEIIKEEDKESSTSELPKEIKSNTNMNEAEKNALNESLLRFSLKIENSFEYEKRLSSHSIKENYEAKRKDEKKIKKKNPKIDKGNNGRKVEKFNLRKPNTNNMLLKNKKSNSKKDYKRNINQNNKEINNLKLNKVQNKNKSKIEKKEENILNKFNKEGIIINTNNINNDKIKITKYNNTNDKCTKNINQNENNLSNVNTNTNVNNYTSKVNTDQNSNDLNKGNDDSAFKNNCPRDNNRRRHTVQTSKLDIHPEFLLKNAINNDTNNIQKNAINSQNIIIINNTVYSHKNQKNKNQTKKEDKKVLPKKGPEDIKVPKDNRNKKKNNNEIIKKVPCDAIKPDIKILIKEAIKNNEAKYNTKTIKIKKSNGNINNDNKNDSFSRTHSGIENSRKNINDIYDENDNFRAHSSHNINIIKNLGLNFEQNQNIDTKQFISFNYTNKKENLELNKQEKVSSNAELIRRPKIKNLIRDKNYIIKNNNNNSKIISKNKTLDFIKPKIDEQQRKIQLNSEKTNSIFSKKEENYNNKDDICILF